MDSPPPNRRTFALLVLGVAAFTVYGSLVPFEYRSRTWDDAAGAFVRAMRYRARIDSRSDALANVLLGVPLGFGLLGLVFVDKPQNRFRSDAGLPPRPEAGRGESSLVREVVLGLCLLPGCLAFAAAVEFAQLYFPARTCSGADVLCQGFGALLGMAAWVLLGRRLVDRARAAWNAAGLHEAAGSFLVGYLVLLAFVQALPLDLNSSPKDIYKKLRDETRFVPFGEFLDPVPGDDWGHAAKLLRVFGLYLPVGLLAARLPGRFWMPGNFVRLMAVALGLAVGMEGIQVMVQSRSPSATDAIAGAAGSLAGWALGRWFKTPSPQPSAPHSGGEGERRAVRVQGSQIRTAGSAPLSHRVEERSASEAQPSRRVRGSSISLEAALVLGQVWLAVLVVVSWQPFDFRRPAVRFGWLPGLPLESGNPLFTLDELITKLVLFAPLGVLTVVAFRADAGRVPLWVAAGIGLSASAVFEVGQLFLRSHTAGSTDVILGGLGAFAGAWVVSRLVRREPQASVY